MVWGAFIASLSLSIAFITTIIHFVLGLWSWANFMQKYYFLNVSCLLLFCKLKIGLLKNENDSIEIKNKLIFFWKLCEFEAFNGFQVHSHVVKEDGNIKKFRFGFSSHCNWKLYFKPKCEHFSVWYAKNIEICMLKYSKNK